MRSAAVPAPRTLHDACLFLDFDGTLVDFAATPDAIRVPATLSPLLASLHERLHGAVALITGRALEDIDRHLAPLVFPVSALHGMQWRDGSGSITTCAGVDGFATQAAIIRDQLMAFVAGTPGLLLEDKGLALALHFREFRGQPARLEFLLEELAATLPPELELLAGEKVVEVRPRGTDKGTAVEAMLATAPYQGRFPIYLGDDLGDLPAVAVVESNGGMAIAVGERIHSRWRLASPKDARTWLAACLEKAEVP